MSEAPENIVKAVGKKVGPLPLWGYAAIVIGGAYGVYWWRNRVGVATPVATTDIGSGMASAGPMPGTNTYDGAVLSTEHAGPAAQTNAQWSRSTADSLVASGSNPTDVATAFTNYLTGTALTPTQQSIINVALTKYGSPPEGIIAPVTAPSTGMAYTVKQGDTFDSIMQNFYGRVNPVDKALVQTNNQSKIGWDAKAMTFNPITVGTVLSLPTNGIAGVQDNSLKAGA